MYKCRLCEWKNLSDKSIFKLKDSLIDGIYLDKINDQKIPKVDFTLFKCDICWLVQLQEIVDHQKIYSNYKFSSTNTKYIVDWMSFLSETLINIFKIKNKKILEIWASDWCFLNLFKTNNFVKWIEPSKLLVDSAKEKYGLDIENWYFWKESYKWEKFDLIICRHVLEHIEKLKDFVDNMDYLVNDKWMIYVEVPDVDIILKGLNYSNFFHEHLNYFSRDVLIDYFSKLWYKLLFLINNEVHNWSFGILLEKKWKDNEFIDIQEKIEQDKILFNQLIAWKNYKKIVWYWAANKTFKLISIFDLDGKLSCIYDINETLSGFFIPTENPILIKKSQDILSDKPDCIVIFATSYTNEIISYLRNDLLYRWDIISLFPEIKMYN
jgi:hypothetical protein